MNGKALLGILAFIYAGFVFYVTYKKPPMIWNMAKIKLFKKILGEKGTVVFFYTIGLLAVALGIWLMGK
ncbi:MAG: hypothetical protein GX046_09415 [Tissierellia bacterium]|nr:hypothetical protein [Tissierellia bacterium]